MTNPNDEENGKKWQTITKYLCQNIQVLPTRVAQNSSLRYRFHPFRGYARGEGVGAWQSMSFLSFVEDLARAMLCGSAANQDGKPGREPGRAQRLARLADRAQRALAGGDSPGAAWCFSWGGEPGEARKNWSFGKFHK